MSALNTRGFLFFFGLVGHQTSNHQVHRCHPNGPIWFDKKFVDYINVRLPSMFRAVSKHYIRVFWRQYIARTLRQYIRDVHFKRQLLKTLKTAEDTTAAAIASFEGIQNDLHMQLLSEKEEVAKAREEMERAKLEAGVKVKELERLNAVRRMWNKVFLNFGQSQMMALFGFTAKEYPELFKQFNGSYQHSSRSSILWMREVWLQLLSVYSTRIPNSIRF